MEGELLPARGDGEAKPTNARPADQAERREVLLAHYEHMGPLPDQHWFSAIEQLHPGATGKLLDDFVADREHARTMESKKVALDRRNLDGFVKYQLRQPGIDCRRVGEFGGCVLWQEDRRENIAVERG